MNSSWKAFFAPYAAHFHSAFPGKYQRVGLREDHSYVHVCRGPMILWKCTLHCPMDHYETAQTFSVRATEDRFSWFTWRIEKYCKTRHRVDARGLYNCSAVDLALLWESHCVIHASTEQLRYKDTCESCGTHAGFVPTGKYVGFYNWVNCDTQNGKLKEVMPRSETRMWANVGLWCPEEASISTLGLALGL